MPIHRRPPELQQVQWRDLIGLTRRQVASELLISTPWLAASLWAFNAGYPMIGAAGSFGFFLTALRQAHGAQHYSLGIARVYQDWVLAVLSVLMLSLLHALQAAHLHHHKYPLAASDVEGATATMPWWRAVVSGPRFIVAVHRSGIRLATTRQRKWILGEATAISIWVGAVSIWGPPFLRWFVAAMVIGECLTGFFAVWTVHHDCDGDMKLARTQRGDWKNLLSYHMFYHLEHHLFPAVPTARLPELAARLDRVKPEFADNQVF